MKSKQWQMPNTTHKGQVLPASQVSRQFSRASTSDVPHLLILLMVRSPFMLKAVGLDVGLAVGVRVGSEVGVFVGS
jgi:hypothetical protein